MKNYVCNSRKVENYADLRGYIMLRFIAISVIILLGGVLVQCSREGSTDIVVFTVPVTIEEVTRGDIASYISQTGTIIPMAEIPIVTAAGGEIRFQDAGDRLLNIGDRVEKDQLLATLTNEEYELSIGLESKKMALDHARRDLEQKEEFVKLGGATQREVDTAKRALLNAENSYKSALLNLDKLNIKSPMSGILTELASFEEGQKISNGTQIGKIERYDRVKCLINITSNDIDKVWKGQEVLVTNITTDKGVYTGGVTKISPTLDPTTRTSQVEVEIDNPGLRLRSGLYVKVEIVVEKRRDVIKIPKHVIITRNNRDVVFVVGDEVAIEKEVQVGIQDSEYAEIIEGLNEGDQLVIRGFETLKNNTKVRISR